MKIGVWLGSTPKKTNGGAFSYTDRLIKLIDNASFPDDIEICFIGLHPGNGEFVKDVISISVIPTFIYKIAMNVRFIHNLVERADKYIIKKTGLKKLLAKHNIKLVYYLTQSYCFDPSFPFIATNWDIGHCSTLSFPELTDSFKTRDNYYRTVLPKALMIFCDSETGIKELMEYTNIGIHKLRKLPIFAGEVSTINLSDIQRKEILNNYNLKEFKFFFYPAQFWAHKNHYNLLLAFEKFLKEHKDYKLVLSGSNKGNFDYIKNIVKEKGLSNNVVFLGFVPLETICCMYKSATALVMASHFGPTNMPPIEAMEHDCPVICSDLGGHREILGDSALYFNSFCPESIYKAMNDIYDNRTEYCKRIHQQKSLTIYNADKSMAQLAKLFEEVVNIRKNWE